MRNHVSRRDFIRSYWSIVWAGLACLALASNGFGHEANSGTAQSQPTGRKTLIDYFRPMPIRGSLSKEAWGAEGVGPRDVQNGLEDTTMKQWCYWDGQIIKGPDGKYHMFASRWDQARGHGGWGGSLAVHAVSDHVIGPNVLIFDPCAPNIQDQLNAVIARQQRAEFGTDRYAYLFKPGKYELDVQIGYYMHLMGLGRSPDDVEITGAVRCRAVRGALTNFWRTVENFSVVPTIDANNVNTWAVSQAATMRRAHIKGNLNLFENGGASGGYLADSKVDGTVTSGRQQQWFSRNDEWGTWNGGVWSMVFVGTTNPPTGQWPASPYTVVEKTPHADNSYPSKSQFPITEGTLK